jgi:uncharacterized Zn finger protein
MTEKQIIEKKNYGDMKLMARMLGISQSNATMILSRPNSKKYQEAIEALKKIIEAREALMAQIATKN